MPHQHTVQLNKKRCSVEFFTLDEGCSNAFNRKKMKVGEITKGLEFSPVLLTLNSQENEIFFQSFVLVNEETEKTMENLNIMNKKTICELQSSKIVQTRKRKLYYPP
jgi:hypothetical protein